MEESHAEKEEVIEIDEPLNGMGAKQMNFSYPIRESQSMGLDIVRVNDSPTDDSSQLEENVEVMEETP